MVCPPLLLQALVECVDLKLAHSLRLVLPNSTAPASRSFWIIKASCLAILPSKANAPAVVIILSPVSILSFISTGMPCSGPRTLPLARSLSIASAILSASGFNCITALSFGPALSIASMRFRYSSVIDREVYSLACIFCCSMVMVTSFSSNWSGFSWSDVSCPFLSPENKLHDALTNVVAASPATEPAFKKLLLCIIINGIKPVTSNGILNIYQSLT